MGCHKWRSVEINQHTFKKITVETVRQFVAGNCHIDHVTSTGTVEMTSVDTKISKSEI